MSGSYHWDPDRTMTMWGPLPLIGFAPGTFLTFAKTVPQLHSPKAGFKRTIYVRRTDTSGTLSALFSPAADVLDVLNPIYQSMDNGGPTIWQPLVTKDLNTGVILCECPLATILEAGMPDAEDAGPTDRTWVWGGDPFIITAAGIALAKAQPTPFPT